MTYRTSARLLLGAAAALGGIATGVLLAITGPPARAEDAAIASPWAVEHATRVRLVGGGASIGANMPRGLVAGIEIELDEGWKTYWRNPGSSGVPPRLEWTGSENLAGAEVLFPAPQRFVDRDGDTIGYKKSVLLPLAITPKDPKLPVSLKLSLEYGVCKDVCVPVQPVLDLTLPPDATTKPAGSGLLAALDRVPRSPAKGKPGDPKLQAIKVDLQGDKPTIRIEATFPADGKGADVFLEAPDGIWIPLAKAESEATGPVRRFMVDLTDGADVADLKGRDIRLTLVGPSGATDTSFKLD